MSSTPLDPQKKPDLFIIRQDTASITLTLSGIDLTGATVFFTAKPTISNSADDSDATIEKTVTSHSDPENGETVIELTSSDTDVTPGKYYYDIQIKNADGSIVSIPVRILQIFGDITRRTT